MVSRGQEEKEPAATHAIPDEALGNSGQARHPICFVTLRTSKAASCIASLTVYRYT